MTLSNYVGKRIYGVIKQWKKTRADYAEMGEDVLKLMANPDTDPQQVLKAWTMYRDSTMRIHLMRNDLATRYPDYNFEI